MSTNVTNEVVRMTFEGDDFEKKISKSLSALQKLKEHLHFGKVADEVEDNSTRMTRALETMANKCETIWSRVTDQIRNNIKDKIMGALNEVKDMTINQLAAGWDKYAEKTEAVATLIGQGYDMDTVNAEMAKLNRYTDETSYQFTNMVQSIGKFTAAGQSLEDANLAMQGIANWAALSGANATKASSAMYQLSQAMGKGALKLDDYKSVQNLGMDTQEFRNQALEAAVALGTLKKNADDTYTVIDEDGKAVEKMTFNLNSFTNNLTDGQWLTSDVMMKVFSKYGSAIDKINDLMDNHNVTMASKAIEMIEETNASVKEEFSAMTETMGWGEDKVREELLKWSQVKEVTDDAIANYREYNKDVTEEQARTALTQKYTKALNEYTKQFGVTQEEAAKQIKRWNEYTDEFGLKAYKAAQEAKTFKDAIDSVKDAASTQWMNVWEKLFGNYAEARVVWTKFANFLYDVLVDWLNDLNDALDKWVEKGGRGILMETFSALGDIIWVIRDAISDINKALFGKMSSKKLLNITKGIHDFVFKIRDFFIELQESKFLENITNFISGIRKTITRLFTAIQMGWESAFAGATPIGTRIVAILEKVTGLVNQFRKSLALTKTDVYKLANFFRGVFRVFGLISDVVKTIAGTLLKGLFPGLGGFFDKLNSGKNTVLDFLDNVGEKLQDFVNKVRGSEFLAELQNKLEKFTEFIRNNIYPVLSNIGGVIVNVFKAIGGAFLWVGGIIVDQFKKIPWDKIKEVLIDLKERLKPLGDVLKKIGNAFKDGLGAVRNSMKDFNDDEERTFFQKVLDAIVEGFNAFRSSIKNAWSSFKDVIKEITESVVWKKIVTFLKNAWTKIKEVFQNYVKPVAMYIWDVVSGPIKTVLQMLKEGRIKEILEMVKTAYQIGALKRIMDFFKTFMEFFKDAHLADIIKSISGVFHSMSSMFKTWEGTAKEAKKAVKAWKNERIANTLLKIVATLAIVIGIVFALSFISPERAKKMGEAFVIVLSAAIVVIGMLMAVAKVAKTGAGSLLSVAAIFVAIAACIAVIAHVIKAIGEQMKTNPDTMLLGFAGVLVIMATVVAALWILLKASTKFAKKSQYNKLLSLAAIIAALGLAVSLMAVSIQEMGEMKAEDFWQAIAGVTLMIATLSASTWLLNVKKSQKGTMALVGLVLVIRYLLIPMLRSIAKNKFDLGQALMAVFIPLLTLAGYLYLMGRIYSNEKTGTKSIWTAVLALAAVLYVISNTLIPAMGDAVNNGMGTDMIEASISLLIVMGTLFAAFKVIGGMDMTTILKGAAGMALGSLAISIAMAAMATALYFNPGSGSDFLEMGLAMAAVLIAMGGAMALIGSFAGSALTGAAAIAVLAGAIALLTGAIIAFKKYVLGESIGDTVGEITNVSGAETSNATNKKKVMSTKTAKSGAIKPTTLSKKAAMKAGQEEAVTYSEGVDKGINSSKAKTIQNESAEDLVKNMGSSFDSIEAQNLLKSYGIDTAELYADGFNDYDVEKILKEAGYENVTDYTEGTTGTKATSEVSNSAEDLINTLCGQYGLDSNTVKDMLNLAGEDTAAKVGEGVGNGDMSTGAQELVNDLNEQLGKVDGSTLQTGANEVLGLFTGGNGLTSATNLGSMTTTGNSLISALCGGLDGSGSGSLAGSFLSGAADSIIGQLGTLISEKASDLWDAASPTLLYLYDSIFHTDYLETGKTQRVYNQLLKKYQENKDEMKLIYGELSLLYGDDTEILGYNLGSTMMRKILTMGYGIEDSKEAFDQFWAFMHEEIYHTKEIEQELAEAEAHKQKLEHMSEIFDEIDRVEAKIVSFAEQKELGFMNKETADWFENYKKYFDAYETYLFETGDLTTKYEDIIDAITNAENKLKETYGESTIDTMKGFSEKSFQQLVDELKTNGTVLFDMGKKNAEEVSNGFDEGLSDKKAVNTADRYFNSFDKAIRSDDNFGIHSPSTWAEGIATNLVTTMIDTMDTLISGFNTPMNDMKTLITDHVSQMILEVQTLLNTADLELRVVPVLEVDGLHYAMSSLEFTSGNSALTSYNMADEIAKAYAGINKPQNEVTDQLTQLQNKIGDLNTSMQNVEKAIKDSDLTVEVHNESDINTTIKKINRQSKMYGKSVVAYP